MAELVLEGELKVVRSRVKRFDVGRYDTALADALAVELHREAQPLEEDVDDFPWTVEVVMCQLRVMAVSVEGNRSLADQHKLSRLALAPGDSRTILAL